jgi:hypothetical protein
MIVLIQSYWQICIFKVIYCDIDDVLVIDFNCTYMI